VETGGRTGAAPQILLQVPAGAPIKGYVRANLDDPNHGT
jgi:hypothetical protein